MDTSEYLGMFLAESREHLETLNLAVDPDRGDSRTTATRWTRSSAPRTP